MQIRNKRLRMVGVLIPPDLRTRLDDYREKDDRPLSSIGRVALEEFLERHEEKKRNGRKEGKPKLKRRGRIKGSPGEMFAVSLNMG